MTRRPNTGFLGTRHPSRLPRPEGFVALACGAAPRMRPTYRRSWRASDDGPRHAAVDSDLGAGRCGRLL
jgi:hypothetical protein